MNATNYVKIARSLLLRMAAAVAGVAALALAVLAFLAPAASAAEGSGPAPIGPGYSENHTGVTCIQKFLGIAMHGVPYGTYGKASYRAVKAYQAAHDLSPDGAVGPETAASMLRAGMPQSCRPAMPTTSSTTTSSASSSSTGTRAGSAGSRGGSAAAPAAPKKPQASTSDPAAAAAPAVPSEPVPSGPSDPKGPNPLTGSALNGKDAHDSGCDTDARTVASGPMIIEQPRTTATQDSQTGNIDVSKDKVGVGSSSTSRRENTTVEATIGSIEIRYSPTCRTAWTRVFTRDESALSGVAITDGKHRQNRDVHPRPGKGGATKPGNYYSPMVGVSPGTQVVGSLDGNAGGGAKLAGDKAPSVGPVTPLPAN